MGEWISLIMFKYFSNQIRGFIGIGSAPEFLTRIMWKKFPKKIKKEIGTAIPSSNNTFLMKGRDIRSGTPKEIELTEKDACEALMPILNQILGGIKEALENTPPELSADLIDMGLVLTGGGALLKNIDKLISQDTGLPVTIADDPLSCVAIGTGRALENEELFSTMLSEY